MSYACMVYKPLVNQWPMDAAPQNQGTYTIL